MVKKRRLMRAMMATVTPTPIPALAPTDKEPFWMELDGVGRDVEVVVAATAAVLELLGLVTDEVGRDETGDEDVAVVESGLGELLSDVDEDWAAWADEVSGSDDTGEALGEEPGGAVAATVMVVLAEAGC